MKRGMKELPPALAAAIARGEDLGRQVSQAPIRVEGDIAEESAAAMSLILSELQPILDRHIRTHRRTFLVIRSWALLLRSQIELCAPDSDRHALLGVILQTIAMPVEVAAAPDKDETEGG